MINHKLYRCLLVADGTKDNLLSFLAGCMLYQYPYEICIDFDNLKQQINRFKPEIIIWSFHDKSLYELPEWYKFKTQYIDIKFIASFNSINIHGNPFIGCEPDDCVIEPVNIELIPLMFKSLFDQ
jgi:hypothetical protein